MKDVHVEVEAVGPFPVFDTGIRPQLKCAVPLLRGRNYSDALRQVKTNESKILLGDFNAYVGNDARIWSRVIGQRGEDNGRFLLQLCCNKSLGIIDIFCLPTSQL